MLEGLAVWALFIYILRLVGMPWNKGTKGFAYIGGMSWMAFVWIGLITWAPMDMTGGAHVQSPHIQLKPPSTQIVGNLKAIHVKPNEEITKGQLIYEIDPSVYALDVAEAKAKLRSKQKDTMSVNQSIEIAQEKLDTAKTRARIAKKSYKRYKGMEEYTDRITVDRYRSKSLNADNKVDEAEAVLDQAYSNVKNSEALVGVERAVLAKAQWKLDNTKVYAPTDGYLTNFILREGQYIGAAPRLQMITNEKYVLMRVNHQAIRNIEIGQLGEFATAVYPGHVFSAEVEGIVEATGESQGSLLSMEENVRRTASANMQNKMHFVRLKIIEPDGYDIPVGSSGIAWISGTKPVGFVSFVDAIRGIIIRMKAQIFYIYSM